MAATFTRKVRGGVEQIDARAASFTLTFLPDEDLYRFTVGGVLIYDIQPKDLLLRPSSLGTDVIELGTWERGKAKGLWLLTFTNGNDSSGTRAEYIARMLEWGDPWVQATTFDTAGGSANPVEVCTVPVGASGRLVVDMNLGGVRIQSIVAHVLNEGPNWADITEHARMNFKLLGTSHRGEAIVNAVRLYGTGASNAVVVALLPETGFDFNVQVSWYYDSRTSASLPRKVVLLAGAAFVTNPPSNPTFTLQRQIFTGNVAGEPGVRRFARLHVSGHDAAVGGNRALQWSRSLAQDVDDLAIHVNGNATLTASSDALWVITVNLHTVNTSGGLAGGNLRLFHAGAEDIHTQSHTTIAIAGVWTPAINAVYRVTPGDTLIFQLSEEFTVTTDRRSTIRIVEIPY